VDPVPDPLLFFLVVPGIEPGNIYIYIYIYIYIKHGLSNFKIPTLVYKNFLQDLYVCRDY
jgi:hypothetical protein